MSNVRDQLATLVILQKAENQIRIVENELAVVEERISQLDQQLAEFQDNVNAKQQEHEQLKKQYRDDERRVKEIEGQITRSNEKLRSVKTNKEYQSMLKEIDELKKTQSGIEDQMLQALEQIEASEKEVSILQKDLIDLTAEIKEQQEEIRHNAQDQRTDLEVAYEKRDKTNEELDLKIQSLYGKIKQKNSGVGVAGVLDAVCQVCRMNIPPQLFIELMRMQSILMCPHCQRIIYPQSLIEENGDG